MPSQPTHPQGLATVTLVVPVFNEEESIPLFIDAVRSIDLSAHQARLEVLFINDGSSDRTLEILAQCQARERFIGYLDLSRNFGKEAAMTAGIEHAQGDALIPIDVDLQDPPELIPEMVALWRQGAEVVLAKRADRSSDSAMKRASASWFYKIHNQMASPPIPDNVGDFRLMDRRVVDAIKTLPESRRFMKGIFAWVGFKTQELSYTRPERVAGSTKFNGWKLWNFALEGLTSFSIAPLRIWTYIGFSVALPSLLYAFFIVGRSLLIGTDVPGYASLIVAVTFLGGLQLVGIGVLGEYLGRTYMEAKGRPVYILRESRPVRPPPAPEVDSQALHP
jgi:polyisoprenyl-phosphate glycosyltransferase